MVTGTSRVIAHDCGGGRSWFFGLFEALDIFSLFSQILIS